MPNFDGTDPLKRGRVIGGGSDPAAGRMRECKRYSPDAEPDGRKNTRLTNYQE
jgi:hypothetical protein